jgi:hypothetical protein
VLSVEPLGSTRASTPSNGYSYRQELSKAGTIRSPVAVPSRGTTAVSEFSDKGGGADPVDFVGAGSDCGPAGVLGVFVGADSDG